MAESARPGWLLGLRAVAIGLALAQMSAGPVYSQVLHLGSVWWSKTWRMYGNRGSDVCVVSFTDRGQPVDRWAVVDAKGRLFSERRSFRRRLEDPAQVRVQGVALCRLLGPEADVRATGACGSAEGWSEALDLGGLCSP